MNGPSHEYILSFLTSIKLGEYIKMSCKNCERLEKRIKELEEEIKELNYEIREANELAP